MFAGLFGGAPSFALVGSLHSHRHLPTRLASVSPPRLLRPVSPLRLRWSPAAMQCGSPLDVAPARLKLSPFWWQRLGELSKPAAVSLVPRLSAENVLTFENIHKSREGTLVDFATREKTRRPDALLLIRVGEFYESFGLDALMLVEHAGLNPMGRKCRAGCPAGNLQATLDGLTSAGLTVAVYEEVALPCMHAGTCMYGETHSRPPCALRVGRWRPPAPRRAASRSSSSGRSRSWSPPRRRRTCTKPASCPARSSSAPTLALAPPSPSPSPHPHPTSCCRYEACLFLSVTVRYCLLPCVAQVRGMPLAQPHPVRGASPLPRRRPLGERLHRGRGAHRLAHVQGVNLLTYLLTYVLTYIDSRTYKV